MEFLAVRLAIREALTDTDAIEIATIRRAGAWHAGEEGGCDSAPAFDLLIGEPVRE
ncbi:hypothetical protein D3C81_1991010 [compost metagenome]